MPEPPSTHRALAVSLGLVVCLILPSRIAWAQPGADDQVTVHDLDPKTGLSGKSPDKRVDYLNVGPLLSLVGGYAHATGIGVEGTWMAYPTGRLPSLGYGAFLQAQLYDEKYFRTGAGAQFSAGPAGAELGLGFRQTDGTYASTISTHMSVFLSIAYFYIAIRVSTPLLAFPTDEPSFGVETALVLGLKLPIAINGRDPSGMAIQAAPVSW